MAIAPYQVLLTPIGRDAAPFELGERLHDELEALGIEVLLDDRRERPGVKFKDADLIGVPLRVTIGNRGLKEGKVELKARGANDAEMLDVEGAAVAIVEAVRSVR